MKADFGRSNKRVRKDKQEVVGKGFEQMMKERKKVLPELEDTINDVLKDYDGGTIAIIKIKEDENGDPEGHQLFIGGVSKIETQLALGKAMTDAADEIREKLIDTVKNNPDTLGLLLGALLSEMKKGK